MTAIPASFSFAPAAGGRGGWRKFGAVAGMLFLGLVWGSFVALTEWSAALICIAAIVCVFTVRDFRVGVLVMIFIMPISASYIFPRSMFGVTGMNPLNVLMVGTLLSYMLLAMPDGSMRRFMPFWILPVYLAPIVIAGLNGMGNISSIPQIFRLSESIDFYNAPTYLRDVVMKPFIIVMYALLVGAAYARSREPAKFLTPMIISMWIMGALVITFFLNSPVKFGDLASEYARFFFSPLGMHANDLGRLYATAFGILLFTWDRTVQRQHPLLKTMLFLTMGIVCVALLLTFSRAAIISLVLIGLIYVLSRPTKKTLFFLALIVPAVLLFMPGAIWYRLGMGVESGATGMSAGRISDIWTPLLPQLLDRPFFGHGLQSVLWAPAMRMGEMMEVTHPHSAYLGALIDFGIIGGLLIFAFWFTVWKGFRKLTRDQSLEPHQRGFFEGAAASLVAFAAAGFVGSSFTPVPEQSFLWLAIGMMFGVTSKQQIEKDRARRMGRRA
ncbi:MAG TPA: O-antigen ligase family protein [Usitatibacter sp.]|nr:O-antigen ligase family protein [Usitatibacter sp.]